MNEVELLRKENQELKKHIIALESELAFLKMHPVFVQGLKGENLIAEFTGGKLTKFSESYDIDVGDKVKIEVKFSKLTIPVKGSDTRRWNWSKPLGWKDKGKDYDFLILIGDKDPRYLDQYPDNSPYVYFVIPHDKVSEFLTSGKAIGSNIMLVTNLKNVRSLRSKKLVAYMRSWEEISSLFSGMRLGLEWKGVEGYPRL